MPQIIASANFISLLGVILIIRKIHKSADNYDKYIGVCVAAAFLFYTLHLSNLYHYAMTIMDIFLPISVLYISKIDLRDGRVIYATALRCFSIMAYILTFITAINIVTGNSVSAFFAQLYNTRSLFMLLSGNRLVTYLGHSLVTMWYMIAYLILKVIDALYISKDRKIILPIVMTILVIGATGSKTGLFAIVAIILLGFGNRKMIKYTPTMILGLYLLLHYGVLDLVLERLSIGIQQGDITTGRLTRLKALLNSGDIEFHMIKGNDVSLLNNSTRMIAALENPLLRWAYLYGIVFTFLMTAGVLVIPFLKLCRGRYIRITMLAAVFLAVVNTFDTICSIGDSMMMCCTIMTLMILAIGIADNSVKDGGIPS